MLSLTAGKRILDLDGHHASGCKTELPYAEIHQRHRTRCCLMLADAIHFVLREGGTIAFNEDQPQHSLLTLSNLHEMGAPGVLSFLSTAA